MDPSASASNMKTDHGIKKATKGDLFSCGPDGAQDRSDPQK